MDPSSRAAAEPGGGHPLAAEFPLEPGDGIEARFAAQLRQPRHVARAGFFCGNGLRLHLRGWFGRLMAAPSRRGLPPVAAQWRNSRTGAALAGAASCSRGRAGSLRSRRGSGWSAGAPDAVRRGRRDRLERRLCRKWRLGRLDLEGWRHVGRRIDGHNGLRWRWRRWAWRNYDRGRRVTPGDRRGRRRWFDLFAAVAGTSGMVAPPSEP